MRHRIVGISFDHMHMGDLLRQVQQHPDADITGVFDPSMDKMKPVLDILGIPAGIAHTDFARCMESAKPTAAIVCSSTGTHADWVEKLAHYHIDILVEKPFAASLAQADRMIAAVTPTGRKLAINWPLAWYPVHRTAHRLITEGTIGDVTSLSYYDGNRGPLYHVMDKIEVAGADQFEAKQQSWFYKREQGGGSLLDYLGYGVTLGTWFLNGRKPLEVMSMVDEPSGLEVDEHSVTVARYENGLSKFETRWGTFTDPWIHQPQPKCGFVLCGTRGTISCYDYEGELWVQTLDSPAATPFRVDPLSHPATGAIAYFLHCVENDLPIEGPLSVEISRIGQQIVDTAFRSAQEKRSLSLVGEKEHAV